MSDPLTGRSAHQADHVLRAFRYQLLQTIGAWLDLRNDEELWIEVGEDFTVVSPDDDHEVQVKFSETADGPRPVSLRTEGIREAITRHWERSEGGNRPCRLTVLARSGAAREQGAEFPARQTGLEYWANVAVAGDTGPLRTLLRDVFGSMPLGEWLATEPNDAELRERLLTRIRFTLNSKGDEPLEQYLRDRIAAIYLEKRHLVSAADQGISTLIDRAFKVATLPQPAMRRLTVIDLHLALEQSLPRQGSLDQLAALLAATGQGMAVSEAPETSLAVRSLRVSPAAIDRRVLINALQPSLSRESIIWLKGSNGVGKSTLATLLAHARGGHWLVCDFRPFSKEGQERGALAVWRELISALNQGPPPTGIILDDLSLAASDLLKGRFAGLTEALAARDGQTIITSNHNPSGALQGALGIRAAGVVDVPYFSILEIRELVSARPAPRLEMIEPWANLVRLTTDGGHPLLAVAKIANLRRRSWPDAALVEDLGGHRGAGIAEARLEARLRLVDEIATPEARALLNRIGSTFTMFDDALAIKLGNARPVLANPGDAFAQLKGSWIEPTSGAFWRLSPLIADLADELPSYEVEQWRRLSAEHWMKSKTLDQWTLPLAFWNAYLGKHVWVLLKLGEVILTLPREKLRATGIILSPLAALGTKASLFADEPLVASMMRLIQLRVADAAEDDDVATKAACAWLREIDDVEHEGMRSLNFMTAAQSFFDLEHVRLPPEVLLRFLQRLQAAIATAQASDDAEVRAATRPMHDPLPDGTTVPGYYLTRLLTRARSSKELEVIIAALDAVEPGSRRDWLNSAARILEGASVWVHNPWAQEQLAGQNLLPTLELYERMGRIVTNWGDPNLEAEFVAAQSILLDEGLTDPQRAIEVVDGAATRLGPSPVLLRQKYKVLMRQGSDSQAADVFLRLEPQLEQFYPFERMLAIRDGAVSCARAGRLAEARRAFGKARDILDTVSGREDLRVGLLLEQALAAWKQDERRDAMKLLATAFEELRRIDPTATRQGQRALRSACGMAAVFIDDLSSAFSTTERRTIAFGQPSQLESLDKPASAPIPNLEDGWNLLVLAEAEHGEDGAIAARAAAAKVRITPVMTALIQRARLSSAVVRRRIDAAVPLIGSAVASVRSASNLASESAGPISQPGMMQQAVADIIVTYALAGAWNAETEAALRTAVIAAWGDESLLVPLIDASHQRNILLGSPQPMLACSLVDAVARDSELSPGGRYVRDLYLVQCAASSLVRPAFEPLLVARLLAGWRHVLQSQRFLLVTPGRNVPAIRDALASMEKVGLRGASDLFGAVAAAAGTELSAEWAAFFERLRGAPS